VPDWLGGQRTEAACDRILVLDGAMGTMIQGYGLDESGYRGVAFKDFSKGFSTLITTKPRKKK
jgi:methionine synthase I (cobalamin-dependent)